MTPLYFGKGKRETKERKEEKKSNETQTPRRYAHMQH